jgi:hypothetical protein
LANFIDTGSFTGAHPVEPGFAVVDDIIKNAPDPFSLLSGSLQKITIDRVLRLVEAVGLEPEIKLRRAA